MDSSFKILPYREWNRLFESINHINEDKSAVSKSQTQINFDKMPKYGINKSGLDGGDTYLTGGSRSKINDLSDDKYGQLKSTATNFLRSAIPNFRFAIGKTPPKIAQISKQVNYINIFNLIMSGIGIKVKMDNLVDDIIKDSSILDDLDMKCEYNKTYYFPLHEGTIPSVDSYNSKGEMKGSGGVDPNILAGYINTANVLSWATGSFKQFYNLGEALSEWDNSVVIKPGMAGKSLAVYLRDTDSDLVGKISSHLYLYEYSGIKSDEGAKETPKDNVKNKWWFNWKPDSSEYLESGDYASNSPEVENEMLMSLFKGIGSDSVATKIQLISKVNLPEGDSASSGSGKPANATSVPANLAYSRGLDIAKKLYQLLGPRVTKGGIEIIWKVEPIDSQKDSNIDLNVISKSPAKNVKDTRQFSRISSVSETKGKAIIKRYKVTFEVSKVRTSTTKTKLGKITGIGRSYKDYDDVDKGDTIVYKKMVDGEISNKETLEGKVIEVSDGVIIIKNRNGNRIKIKENRFVRGPRDKAEDIEG